MLNHIANTAAATVLVTDVNADVAYFWGSIFGAARQSDDFHHLVIWNIIPHIEHLVGCQVIFLEQLLEFLSLDGTAQEHIVDADCLVPGQDGRLASPRYDGNVKSAHGSQSKGITIFRISRSKQFATRINTDIFRAQNAIHIKDECFYLLQIVVYHRVCFC